MAYYNSGVVLYSKDEIDNIYIAGENGGFFRKNGLIWESECVLNTRRHVL